MFVLIVGGAKVGSYLADLLLQQNVQIKIVEYRPEVLVRLHKELPTENIVQGDGTNAQVLIDAGITSADVVAAVTGDDEVNLVVASLAHTQFSVPRVIARVNSPKNAWLFTPDMGVDVAINQAELMVRLIQEEMSLGDMMTLFKLRRGEVALVEEKIPPESPVVGKTLKELAFPPNCTLAAVMRGDEVIVPRGDTRLLAEDEILAIVRSDHRAHLSSLLSGVKVPDSAPGKTTSTVAGAPTAVGAGWPKDKADLLARIQHEWTALLQAVHGLSDEQMTAADPGGWSVKDNLAHITEWEGFVLANQFQGLPPHEAIRMDRATFDPFDETRINAVLFERNKERSLTSVLLDLHDTHAQLLAALERASESELAAPSSSIGPEQKPVMTWVVYNTYEHYEEHRKTISRCNAL
ncbi:MAG: NAD-binding protein [Thermoflexales bacterium]|nr:NAD-binding protein [Thermoflexales bacterium]